MSDVSRTSTPDSEASSTASTASTKGKSMKPPAKRKRAAPKSKITTNKLTKSRGPGGPAYAFSHSTSCLRGTVADNFVTLSSMSFIYDHSLRSAPMICIWLAQRSSPPP